MENMINDEYVEKIIKEHPKIIKYIEQDIIVQTTEHNTYKLRVDYSGELDFSDMVDGSIYEEDMYCKKCNKALRSDRNLLGVMEHIEEYHLDLLQK